MLMETKKAKPSTWAFTAKRFAGFVRVFLKNRRATAGLVIIFGFVFIAVAAPLLTPFDALGSDPTFQGYVAGKIAAPAWLRQLPVQLGGDPTLSENIQVVKDPGAPRLVTEGGVLNLTESKEGVVDVRYVDDVGYSYLVPGMRYPSQNGSLAITFSRSSGSILNETTVSIFTDFDYPYLGVPGIVIGNSEFLVNGTERIKWYPEEQWYIIRFDNQGKTAKNSSVSILTNTARGLYIAASTGITSYFGPSHTASESPAYKLKDLGYNNWKEWLNGTGTLPDHWGNMSWTVSEGSLTERIGEGNETYHCFMNETKICDPNIYSVINWTKISAILTKDCFVGNTTIYVSSVEEFKGKEGEPIVIGSGGEEEINMIKSINATENSLKLYQPLLVSHLSGEPVTVDAQKLVLFDNLVIPPKSYVWVLVCAVIKNVDNVYDLKLESTFATAVFYEGLSYPFSGWSSQIISSARGWKLARKEAYLHVPVRIRVFFGCINQANATMNTLFPVWGRETKGFSANETTKDITVIKAFSGDASNNYWILSRNSRYTFVSVMQYELPANIRTMFPTMPGRYRYGVEITFMDTTNIGENVSTTVYVDDFAMNLLGTSYGLLGTDQYARDLFSQLIYGTRISLYIGILVAVLSVCIGLMVGLVSGYVGGAVDEGLMRFNDFLLVLPGLPLLIVLVAVLGAKIENLVILFGLLGWMGFARLVRSQVLSLKERPFIEAAKAAGAGRWHVIVRHVMPNVMSLVYVSLATSVPGAITGEAALAWLGFYDPGRMSWGRMLHEVFVAGATRAWWWIIPPGVFIGIIATAFILLGYALDEILNPKLRMRK
jgi:ABC-type dipeptide/oligopeptide/nickel transport system permease subunit